MRARVEIVTREELAAHDLGFAELPVVREYRRAEELRVGVVRNNGVQLVPIKIGTDYGEMVQVTSGLTLDDEVIESPSDSLVSGTTVHIRRGGTGNNP